MGTRPSPVSLGLTETGSDPSQPYTGFISVTLQRNLRASVLAANTVALVSSSDPLATASHFPQREAQPGKKRR